MSSFNTRQVTVITPNVYLFRFVLRRFNDFSNDHGVRMRHLTLLIWLMCVVARNVPEFEKDSGTLKESDSSSHHIQPLNVETINETSTNNSIAAKVNTTDSEDLKQRPNYKTSRGLFTPTQGHVTPYPTVGKENRMRWFEVLVISILLALVTVATAVSALWCWQRAASLLVPDQQIRIRAVGGDISEFSTVSLSSNQSDSVFEAEGIQLQPLGDADYPQERDSKLESECTREREEFQLFNPSSD